MELVTPLCTIKRHVVAALSCTVLMHIAPPVIAAEFTNSGQSLGIANSFGVALGDLDGDGDLDAFVANASEGNRVWLNDGWGVFSDSGQSLGTSFSYDVALADLDGDFDLDAAVANGGNQADRIWLNDGSGIFFDSGQSLGSAISENVRVAQLDSDGDLDVIVSHDPQDDGQWTTFIASVWLNDGSANLTGGPALEGQGLVANLDVGDLDGDGDMDSATCNPVTGGPGHIHLNSGAGVFTRVGEIASAECSGIALGDFDLDGDLDAFIARADISGSAAQWIFWNNGAAVFTDSGQNLGSSNANAVALGDLDNDGDLDAFLASWSSDKVWLNNGFGTFTDSGQALGSTNSYGAALGDLNGDGSLDAFVVTSGANTVWFNQIRIFSDGFESGGTDDWSFATP